MFPQLPSLVSLSYNFFKNRAFQSSSVAQQVKDLVMLLQQLRPLLQLGFGPWTGDFCMPWKWQKTKNQNKKKNHPKTGLFFEPQICLFPVSDAPCRTTEAKAADFC